jgi:hypothetical protein
MLLCAGLSLAAAQEKSGVTPPPKVLLIDREFLKPGKGGAPHEKTESAFVQAAMRAKEPTHYLAMNSLSGKNRALFLFGYDSFEAWEKDNMTVQGKIQQSRGGNAGNEGPSDTDARHQNKSEHEHVQAET